MEKKENNKNKTILLVIGIILLLAIIAVGSYAIYSKTMEYDAGTIKTGTVKFEFSEDDSNLSLSSNSKLDDGIGIISDKYFQFTISATATGNVDIGYYIYYTPVEMSSNINENGIKIYLSKVNSLTDPVDSETQVLAPTLLSDLTTFNKETFTYDANATNHLIYADTFNFTGNATKTINYRLKLWVNTLYSVPSNNTTTGNSHEATSEPVNCKIKINVIGVSGEAKNITAN